MSIDVKPFQKHSSDQIYHVLFDPGKTSRYLLADEVGLGKTVITMDVIKKFLTATDQSLRIFYTCPNLSLADQNETRLEPTWQEKEQGLGEDDVEYPEGDRLSLYLNSEWDDKRLLIFSITPNTSLDVSNKTGKKKEKKLLFCLLYKHIDEIDSYDEAEKESWKYFLSALFRQSYKYGSGWPDPNGNVDKTVSNYLSSKLQSERGREIVGELLNAEVKIGEDEKSEEKCIGEILKELRIRIHEVDLKDLCQGHAECEELKNEIASSVDEKWKLIHKIQELRNIDLTNDESDEVVKEFLKTFYSNLFSEDELPEKFSDISAKMQTRLCLEFLKEHDEKRSNAQDTIDLIILDEFQNYEKILNTEDDTLDQEVVKEFFQLGKDNHYSDNRKTLLLSATPYSSYSPVSGRHYESFKSTLKFLFKGMEDEVKTNHWQELESECFDNAIPNEDSDDETSFDVEMLLDCLDHYHDSIKRKLSPEVSDSDSKKIQEMRECIERCMKKVITRTERNQFVKGRRSHVVDRDQYEYWEDLPVDSDEMEDYDQVRQRAFQEILSLQNVKGNKNGTHSMNLSFWKSGSRLLSFMNPNNYKYTEKLYKQEETEDEENITEELKEKKEIGAKYSPDGFLRNLKKNISEDDQNIVIMSDHDNLDRKGSDLDWKISNEKMKYLHDHTIPDDLETMPLWMPPSFLYHRSGNEEEVNKFERKALALHPKENYDLQDTTRIKKALVFSNWKFVPDYVSAVLSRKWEEDFIESEGGDKSLTMTGKFPAARSLYPSLFLASFLGEREVLVGKVQSTEEYREKQFEKLKDKLINDYEWKINENNDADSNLATIYEKLLMLDKLYLEKHDLFSDPIENILQESFPDNSDIQEYPAGKETHKNLNNDQVYELVDVGLFSPAVSVLRNLMGVARHYLNTSEQENILDTGVLKKTYKESLHLCYLGDKQETTLKSFFQNAFHSQLINKEISGDTWTRKIIPYCKKGHFEEVLNEYFYLLREEIAKEKDTNAEKNKLTKKIIDDIINELRTTLMAEKGQVYYNRFEKNESGTWVRDQNRKTTHFAMAFKEQLSISENTETDEGSEEDEEVESSTGKIRQSEIRKAFNSPFLPFVMVTTSAGEEGLDFHKYCQDVVHWNLPHNPVDMEQREGRVNRYNAQVVRHGAVREAYNVIYDQSGEKIELQDLEQKNTHFRFDTYFQLLKRFSTLRERYNYGLFPHWQISISTENGSKQGDDTATNELYNVNRHVVYPQLSKDLLKLDQAKECLQSYRLALGKVNQEAFVESLSKKIFTNEDNSYQDINQYTINLNPIDPVEYAENMAKEIVNSEEKLKHLCRVCENIIEKEKETLQKSQKVNPSAKKTLSQLEALITEKLNDLSELPPDATKETIERLVYFACPVDKNPDFYTEGYTDDIEVLKNGF